MPKTFQPLTREQYQKAIDKGYSPTKIIEFEQKRKASFAAPPAPKAPASIPKTGGNPLGLPGGAPVNWSNPTEAIKGGLKSVAQAGVDLDTAAQSVGKQVLRPVGSLVNAASSALGLPGRTNVAAQGIPAFNPGTPQAKDMQATLTPNNPQQQTGAFLSNVAQAAIPVGSAEVKAGVKAAEPVIAKLSEVSAQASGKKAAQEAIDVVMPKNTPKATSKAIAAGRGEVKGWLKTASLTADKATQQAARAVEGIVSKSKTGIENVNAVRDALGKEAESLKAQIAQVDHPYTFTELAAKLKSITKPVMLRSDTTLNRAYDQVLAKAMDLAKSKDGNVSSLLDTRKEFDAYVQQEFPNIFSDTALSPMKSAVKNIRNGINDFIESNLPNDVAYKDSLHKQSSMFDAIDNIASKASDEVGTNLLGRAGRAIKDHKLISAAAGYEALKHTIAPTLPGF